MLVVFLLFTVFASAETETDSTVVVVMETELGSIEIEVAAGKAPLTSANFLKYVEQGFYEGGMFHRTVKLDNQPDKQILIEVIQGGINPEKEKESFPAISLERTSVTGLRHLDGTVSMARNTADSATSDFFVCINDQPSLDFGGMRNPDGQGFAAFGKVIRGMDIVKKIQASPAEGQILTPPVKIRKAFIKK